MDIIPAGISLSCKSKIKCMQLVKHADRVIDKCSMNPKIPEIEHIVSNFVLHFTSSIAMVSYGLFSTFCAFL